MSEILNLIKDQFSELMNDVHVCMPAEVIKYDADKMTCSAQPLIKRKLYRRESSERYPVINNIPVVFSRTSKALIRLPVNKKDVVTLIFADTELSNWINSKGAVNDYLDNRTHHINDCFALVGGYPSGVPHTAVNPNALEIIVESGTKITIGNETDDLVDIAFESFTRLKTLSDKLSETLTNIAALTVTCSGAGNPSSVPVNAALFTATKTLVDNISTEVQSELTKLSNIKV